MFHGGGRATFLWSPAGQGREAARVEAIPTRRLAGRPSLLPHDPQTPKVSACVRSQSTVTPQWGQQAFQGWKLSPGVDCPADKSSAGRFILKWRHPRFPCPPSLPAVLLGPVFLRVWFNRPQCWMGSEMMEPPALCHKVNESHR